MLSFLVSIYNYFIFIFDFSSPFFNTKLFINTYYYFFISDNLQLPVEDWDKLAEQYEYRFVFTSEDNNVLLRLAWLARFDRQYSTRDPSTVRGSGRR